MFNIPNAKRVRREELYTHSDSGASSPADSNEDTATDLFRQRMNRLLDIETHPESFHEERHEEDVAQQQLEDADDAFDFNLFAPTSTNSNACTPQDATSQPSKDTTHPDRQRIRLSPATAILGFDSAGFPLNYTHKPQQRPHTFYFASPSPTALAHFRQAAISPALVKQRATHPWPDGRLLDQRRPWRVAVWLPTPPSSSASHEASYKAQTHDGTPDKPRRRTRLGKKTRIRRRERAQRETQRDEERAARRAEEEQRARDKEEHVRRKKSEMNRKKQMRKREKERERKAAEEGGGGGGTAGHEEADGAA